MAAERSLGTRVPVLHLPLKSCTPLRCRSQPELVERICQEGLSFLQSDWRPKVASAIGLHVGLIEVSTQKPGGLEEFLVHTLPCFVRHFHNVTPRPDLPLDLPRGAQVQLIVAGSLPKVLVKATGEHILGSDFFPQHRVDLVHRLPVRRPPSGHQPRRVDTVRIVEDIPAGRSKNMFCNHCQGWSMLC